jgi:serine/threonine-protein kinase
MALSIDDVLDGKYRVVRLIGEGGMGTVYEGEHVRIKRRVAIKALLPSIATVEGIERFEREAQAAGEIGNEHILEVLDLGMLASGEHYMVMEYLDGQTLAQRLADRGRLGAEETAHIALQVLIALAAAHGAGIIHRDMKPENVFILPEKAGHRDFVKLIDFGISKFTRARPEAMNVTKTGSVLGTPFYMSPELCRGAAPADARTDLYGVGVMMYEAVSGRLPFQSDTFNDLLFRIVFETAPPLQTLVPEIDATFAAMVTRAMQKDPAARYQSANDLANELIEWLQRRGALSGSHMSAVSGSRLSALSGSHLAGGVRLSASMAAAAAAAAVATTAAPPALEAPAVASPSSTSAQPAAPSHAGSGSHARTWEASQSGGVQPKVNTPAIARGVAVVAGLLLAVGVIIKIKAGPSTTSPTTPSSTSSVASVIPDPVASTSQPVSPNVPSASAAAVTPSSTAAAVSSASASSKPVATASAPRPVVTGSARPHSQPSSTAAPTTTKPQTNEDEIPAVR